MTNSSEHTGRSSHYTADPSGRTPRHGEVSAYARAAGLMRVVIRARLKRGELYVGDDGLIYPRLDMVARHNGGNP